jgi:hypothetical protein
MGHDAWGIWKSLAETHGCGLSSDTSTKNKIKYAWFID